VLKSKGLYGQEFIFLHDGLDLYWRMRMTSMVKATDDLWFEDFEVGESQTTPGRTITETDMVNFAGISGDFNPIHMDAEFAKTGPFGRRVVFGLLVMSIASGLVVQTGIVKGLQGGFREITQWKFMKPVFIGDTIHVEYEITESRPMPRAGGGLIVLEQRIKNQYQETVMKGSWTGFVLNRPAN
jgi:acyl dehydratase